MTREKAEELVSKLPQADHHLTNVHHQSDVDSLIDKVFNDFESRICGNCKHWVQENTNQMSNDRGICKSSSNPDGNYYINGITHKNYGCVSFD